MPNNHLGDDHSNLEAALKSLEQRGKRIDSDEYTMSAKTIGVGGYGAVFPGVYRGQDVAVKVAHKTRHTDIRQAYRLVRELIVWADLKHRNILPLVGFYLGPKYSESAILSPLSRCGNLDDYLAQSEKPSDLRRLGLALDTLRGLDYLHDRKEPIIHGDLKSVNVLIADEGHAMLCDFGLSKALSAKPIALSTASVMGGTRMFSSPELLEGEGAKSCASDVWAWGCLFVEIMKNQWPYQPKESIDYRDIVDHGYLPASRDLMSQPLDLWPVVAGCWEIEPARRSGVGDIVKTVECLLDEVRANARLHFTPDPLTLHKTRNGKDMGEFNIYNLHSLPVVFAFQAHSLGSNLFDMKPAIGILQAMSYIKITVTRSKRAGSESYDQLRILSMVIDGADIDTPPAEVYHARRKRDLIASFYAETLAM